MKQKRRSESRASEKLMKFFSFTIGIWTNSAVDGYLTLITVDYIVDEWEMFIKVILTSEMAKSHTGQNIFSVVGSIVTKKANLKPENVDMLVFLNKNLPPIDI